MPKANILTVEQAVQAAYKEHERMYYGNVISPTIGELFVKMIRAYEEHSRVERSDFRY